MSRVRARRLRLAAQLISAPQHADPAAAVAHLGAVQAQDLPASQWAIGLRTRGATLATVEDAVESRSIVRTWPMRGTLHFVAGADVRWMVALLAPRAAAGMRGRRTELGLSERDLARGHDVVCAELAGGQRRTRPQLYAALAAGGVDPAGQRGIHVLGWLAHQAVICQGPLDGKQPTFVLLDEWVPQHPKLSRGEALARLGERYFTSHGPASVQDLAWWAGLPLGDARTALAAVADRLECVRIDGTQLWFAPKTAVPPRAARGHLLPAYDEYLLGYAQRSLVLDAAYSGRIAPGGNGIFRPLVVVDGTVVGQWRRRLTDRAVAVEVDWFETPTATAARAAHAAARRYAAFLGRPLIATPCPRTVLAS
jgi:Winged helix DNA-binding domain